MADTAPATTPAASRWSTASSGVRSAATWLATTTAAIAGAVFGAGPIFKVESDPASWETGRWILVLFLIVVGALAVIYVIGRLLAMQVPVEITLDHLPPKLKARIEGNALGEYLPGDATSLEDFKDRLKGYASAAIALKAAADAEQDAAEKASLNELATIQEHNRTVYREKRDELYQLASYEIERDRLTPALTWSWTRLGAAAVVAIVAMATFSFVTHATGKNAEKEKDAEAAAKAAADAPVGATLAKKAATSDLWNKLGLQSCELSKGAGEVPVFVLAATEENLDVQTLGYPEGCQRFRFSIPRELVTLLKVEPTKATVKVKKD